MLVLLSAVAAVILADVLGTVFFGITVAYLLLPVRRRLIRYGLSKWTASLLATLAAFLAVVAVSAPLLLVVLRRIDEVVALLVVAPDEVTLELLGFTYAVTLDQASAFARTLLQGLTRRAATAIPVLALKLSVFALVVFSLLHHQVAVKRTVTAVVPGTYRDVIEAFDERTRETLFAIYVLQAATAVATFLFALPVFFGLGYRYPFTLATVSAVFQFLPVVGPSVLVFVVAGYHLAVGDLAAAAAVAVLGSVFVGWLPDVLVRPRLARETADIAGGLYFVGFVGGLLSLGPIGIIAGPLVIVLVVETAGLLAAELDGR